MDEINNKRNLKIFFIKLISIAIVFVISLNVLFNLIFDERLKALDKILLLNEDASRYELKEKIREELNDGLNNENLLSEEDKILLFKLYIKLKKEFKELDKSNL
tara:strand:- start:966 stop:1277 length:312 start_codon:yes stop_codon:yes gene_type:complete